MISASSRPLVNSSASSVVATEFRVGDRLLAIRAGPCDLQDIGICQHGADLAETGRILCGSSAAFSCGSILHGNMATPPNSTAGFQFEAAKPGSVSQPFAWRRTRTRRHPCQNQIIFAGFPDSFCCKRKYAKRPAGLGCVAAIDGRDGDRVFALAPGSS